MRRIIIVIFAVLLAFGVTGPKVIKMCQIKGWIDGAKVERVTITQKWNQTPDIHPSGRNSFWVSWTGKSIKQIGNHRISVTKEKWNMMKLGDKLEIIHVKGDKHPYLRDGIFVDPGNFIFDIVLLIAELGLAIYFSVALIRDRKKVRET